MLYLSLDHLVDVSRDFVGGVPSSKVTTLLSLRFIGLVKVKINVFYLSRDHDIENPRDFVGELLSS